jgi:hypothetical protein
MLSVSLMALIAALAVLRIDRRERMTSPA